MLFGRDAERALIQGLLDRARLSQSSALVLRGEPGSGKTALLEAARKNAGDLSVLRCAGVESESELPFAGLDQLVRPALHLIDRLPTPQAQALRGALGLSARSGDDRFLISAACLTLLSELAEKQPVLCLIDDVQWLDAPSVDALLFVARRVDAEGILLLFAMRDGERDEVHARDLPELVVSPLDDLAAASLIRSHVDGPLAESVLDMLVRQADGNALALVELPVGLSADQLAGRDPLPYILPLTRGVERLFVERVRRLPADTQRVLTILAVEGDGRLATVLKAAEQLGITRDALAGAERAGLVAVSGSTLAWRHPMIRSAVYHDTPSSELREAHLALVDVLVEPQDADRRAWHQAAAAVGPDADAADALEGTAERARLRSGHAAAASALERAAELSVDASARARRLVGAARAAWHAGRPEQSSALLDRAETLVVDPRMRADLEQLRALIWLGRGEAVAAFDLLLAGAEAIAPVDARKALEMLFSAREAAGWEGDVSRVLEITRRVGAVPSSADQDTRFLADLLQATGRVSPGSDRLHSALTDPTITPYAPDVLSMAATIDEPLWLIHAAFFAQTIGDEASQAALARRAISLARAWGALDVLTQVLWVDEVTGLIAGRTTMATEATEGLTFALQTRLPANAGMHAAILAWLAAIHGDDEKSRQLATQDTETTKLSRAIAEMALGLLDLSRRRHESAVAHLVEAERLHTVFALTAFADLVEAFVGCGQLDAAQAAVKTYERFASPVAPSWARALAARCRALVSSGAESESEFVEAIQLHAEAGRRFDQARTELLFGEQLRRRRQRVESRTHLRAAMEIFRSLDASVWAERARSELRASGETAHRGRSSEKSRLTPQELQVARLVAHGLSNKDVAAELFLSPRTVDAHLRRIFAKLDVTSRTQLARLSLD